MTLTAAAPDVVDWDSAGCLTADPEMFYPEVGHSNTSAKRVCAACPIRVDCLAHAMRTREQHGIWGGLSIRDRQKVRAATPSAAAARLLAGHTEKLARLVPPPESTCNAGHSVTGGNAMRNGSYPDGRDRWRCRACYTARQAAA